MTRGGSVRIPRVMTKAADTSTTERDRDRANKARRLFFTNLFDLSWRLMGAMLLPILIGLYIDSVVGRGQAFALTGFVVGMILGALVLRNVVIKLSKGQ